MKIYSLVRQYPVLRLLLFFVSGILIAYQLQSQFSLILNYFCIITGLFFVLSLLFSNTIKFKTVYIFFITGTFVLLGITLTSIHLTPPTIQSTENLYSGIVYAEPQIKKNSVLIPILLHPTHTKHQLRNGPHKVQLYAKQNTRNLDSISIGKTILVKATIRKISNLSNPNEFDYAKYMAIRGIFYSGFVTSEEIYYADSKAFHLNKSVAQIRNRADNIINTNIQNQEAKAIIRALTLGNKHFLSDELKQSFASAGAMHVLAVSGLHIGILYGFLNIVLSFLNRTKKLRALKVILSILFIWAYAALTGLSPSVCRAALMFSIISLGKTINRDINYYNLLATSALFLLVINPSMLFDVGFQLSFLAVTGIVYFQPRLYRILTIRNPIMDWVYKLFCVSVAAQISTAPLTIYYFNQFPTYFWLTNIFLIPLVLVVMVASVLLYTFFWLEPAATYISKFIEITLRVVQYGINTIEHLPFSVFKINSTDQIITTLLFATILFLTKWLNLKKTQYLLYFLSIIICLNIYNLTLRLTASTPDLVFYNTPKAAYVSINNCGNPKLIFSNSSDYHAKWVKNYFTPQLIRNTKKENIELISIDSLLSTNKVQAIDNFLQVTVKGTSTILIAHEPLKHLPRNTTSSITFVSGSIWPPNKLIFTQKIVLGNKLYRKQKEAWKRYSIKNNIELIDLADSGSHIVYLLGNDTIYNYSILPQHTDQLSITP